MLRIKGVLGNEYAKSIDLYSFSLYSFNTVRQKKSNKRLEMERQHQTKSTYQPTRLTAQHPQVKDMRSV